MDASIDQHRAMRALRRVLQRHRLGAGRVGAEHGHPLFVHPDGRFASHSRLLGEKSLGVSVLQDLSGPDHHDVALADRLLLCGECALHILDADFVAVRQPLLPKRPSDVEKNAAPDNRRHGLHPVLPPAFVVARLAGQVSAINAPLGLNVDERVDVGGNVQCPHDHLDGRLKRRCQPSHFGGRGEGALEPHEPGIVADLVVDLETEIEHATRRDGPYGGEKGFAVDAPQRSNVRGDGRGLVNLRSFRCSLFMVGPSREGDGGRRLASEERWISAGALGSRLRFADDFRDQRAYKQRFLGGFAFSRRAQE